MGKRLEWSRAVKKWKHWRDIGQMQPAKEKSKQSIVESSRKMSSLKSENIEEITTDTSHPRTEVKPTQTKIQWAGFQKIKQIKFYKKDRISKLSKCIF